MSFSQDIRSSGHFQEQFGKLRRRMNKAELPPDDLESLQGHINDIRSQVDWLEGIHIEDNLHNNPVGPHQFVFEPDNVEVKMFNTFSNPYTYKLQDRGGVATFADITLTGSGTGAEDYNIIEIGDNAVTRSPVTTSTYHYEGWKKHDGVSDFIHIPSVTSIANLPQFSVACWFRTIKTRDPIVEHPQYGAEGEGFMVCKGGWLSGTAGQQLSYGLWHSDADNIRGGFEETDNTDHIVTSGLPYRNDGLWHHACVTYSGTVVTLYLDGVNVGTHATTATPEVNSQDLTIGRQSLQGPNNSPLFFEGDLDQIYIWNNDLTSGEVSALYSNGTVPQASAIVKQLAFGGSGDGKTDRKCYFAIPDGTINWEWVKNPTINLNNGVEYLIFDGLNDSIDCGINNGELWSQSLTKFSFTFWVYPNTNVGLNRICVAHDTANVAHAFKCEIQSSTPRIDFNVRDSLNVAQSAQSTAIVLNDWNHIACVYDNSLGSQNVKIYVNGVLGGVTDSLTEAINLSANLRLGGPSDDLQGYLQDFRWWTTKALNQTEITNIMNDSSSAPTPDYRLKLNEGSGTILIDSISDSKTATMFGSMWTTPTPVKKYYTIPLNVGTNTRQFIYYDNFGSDYDFTSQPFSFGIWIYPTDLSNSGQERVIAFRSIDGANEWSLQIDDVDNKVFAFMEVASVVTRREYATPLTINNWYYLNLTWDPVGPTLSLKVNDNADTTSSKTDDTGVPDDDLFFIGSYPSAESERDFKGYVCFPHYYKHSTLLTTAERTSLYNYGTRTDTTKPFHAGFGRLEGSSPLFDGVDDNLNLGNHADLWSKGLSKYAFSFWIYATAAGGVNMLVARHGNGGYGFEVDLDSSVANQIYFQQRNVDTTVIHEANTGTQNLLTLNAWHQVIVSYDNSLGSANGRIYVDGILGSQTFNFTDVINSSNVFELGGPSTDLQGNLTDFRFWDAQSFNLAQAQNFYVYGIMPSEPVYWARLDEGIGTPRDHIRNRSIGFTAQTWSENTPY